MDALSIVALGVASTAGQGEPGPAGNGIESIEKTSTSGLVDTYTITYTDSSPSTFTVTNGADGQDGTNGQDGAPGTDGVTFTPSVSNEGVISWTNDGDLPNPQSVNIKGPAGQDGTNGTNGQDGAAATITVGTVTTGQPGTSASVTNSGTSSAAVFDFVIPEGQPGSSGSYSAGTGIDITNSTISIDNTVALKTDIPAAELPTITGNANKVLKVNSGATAVEWANESTELPIISSGDAGKVLAVNSLETGTEWITAASGGGDKVYYGTTSSTSGAMAVTVSDASFSLAEGIILAVKFLNAQSSNSYSTISVNSGTAVNVRDYGSLTTNFRVPQNSIQEYLYDGTQWTRISAQPQANTTTYGITTLEDSTSSTATNKAATPNAVKSTYDLANGKQDALVSGTNIKTINNTSILGSGDISTAELPIIVSGDSGKVLKVNSGETGVEWGNESTELPTIAAGDAGKVLTVNSGETGVEWAAGGGGSSYTFTNGLTESSGTVSWDLNNNIKIFEDTTTEPNKGLIVNTTSFDSTLKTYGESSIAFGYAYGDYNTIEAGSRQTVSTSYPPKGNLAFGWVHGGTNANRASIKALGTGSLAIGHAEGSSSATTSIAVESLSGGTGIAAGYAKQGTIKAQYNGGAAFALGHASDRGAVQATGDGSLAVGYSSGSSYKLTASGDSAFAIGEASEESAELTASGKASFAQGRGVQATGFGSVAHGYKSICSGNYATANGFRSKASSPYQFVIGKDNIEDTQSQYYFIIGNGTADDARSNALTVDTAGNLVCNNIPAPPSSDGNYVLQCSVSSGVATYSWVAQS